MAQQSLVHAPAPPPQKKSYQSWPPNPLSTDSY